MANTNCKNPNAPEPTRQSARAAGKGPTTPSPPLRGVRYDEGGKRKDPPKSLHLPLESTVQQGTDRNTQRNDLPKDSRKDSPKDSPSFQLTIEEWKQFEERKQLLLLQGPHWKARDGDNRSPNKSPIDAPPLPQIDNPLAFGIMPTLVPLQDVTTAAILARRYPK